MNDRLVALSLFLAFVFSSCALLDLFRERDDFIRARGTQLTHNGKPYYFAGTNAWYHGYLGSPGAGGDRPRLLRELDSLKSNGVTNLRILAASEESYIPWSVKPVIQQSPGVVNDSLLQGLDFALAEMAKRHMHAVLYLNNYWEWSGGMVAYNVWSGKEPVDPTDSAKGWGAFMDFSASFYANDAANLFYRNYLRMIITRKNSINGRLYREDPTIMSWQLANEPRPGSVGQQSIANLPMFYRWIDQTTLYIHALDTNHMVSTGSEGSVGTLLSAEYYTAAHSTPNINYLTMHLWPMNWGWFDPKHPSETLPQTEKNALDYVSRHFAVARKLNKPIVLEEFGIDRDAGEILPGTPTTVRDRYYAMVVRALYDSALAGAPLAGYNFWAWGGNVKALHPDGMWKQGDPFMGDPPHEPQGRNAIFSSDTSTLRIIRENAEKFSRLGVIDTLRVSRIQ